MASCINSKTYLRKCLLTGKALLVYIFGLLCLVLLSFFTSIILLPLLIYRRLIFQLAPILRPELGKMVSSQGSILACADPNRSPRTKLTFSVVIEGCPDIENFHRTLRETLEELDLQTGQILYPELQQNLTNWMGYPFWKPIKNFNLEDHVFYDDTNVTGGENVSEMLKLEGNTPFKETNALWQIKIFRSYTPTGKEVYFNPGLKYSLAVISIDHSVVDGFSMLKLAYKVCGVTYVRPAREAAICIPHSGLKVASILIGKILRPPYDIGKVTSDFMWSSKIPWYSGDRDSVPARGKSNSNGHFSDLVPFSLLREIKSKHGVSTIAVIIEAFTSSLREMLLERAEFTECSTIPDEYNFIIPLPLSGHPDKLRNHVTGVQILIPIGEMNPLKRLRKIENRIQNLKNSSVPHLLAISGQLMASFPSPILRFVLKSLSSRLGGAFLTSFPGPVDEMLFYGTYPAKEISFGLNFFMGTRVLAGTFITYRGYCRFGVVADPPVFSDGEAPGLFVRRFFDELEILRNTKPLRIEGSMDELTLV